MLEAGAKGYVVKGSPSEELVSAIRRVMNDETYLGSGLDAIQL